jgi:hypothetical protein
MGRSERILVGQERFGAGTRDWRQIGKGSTRARGKLRWARGTLRSCDRRAPRQKAPPDTRQERASHVAAFHQRCPAGGSGDALYHGARRGHLTRLLVPYSEAIETSAARWDECAASMDQKHESNKDALVL